MSKRAKVKKLDGVPAPYNPPRVVEEADARLMELGVCDAVHRREIAFGLWELGCILLRQRHPRRKKDYRTIMLYPGEPWTLDKVRARLGESW